MKPTAREQKKHDYIYGIKVPPQRINWLAVRLLLREDESITFPRIKFFNQGGDTSYYFSSTKKRGAVLSMRHGCTLGDLLHELAHHVLFETVGEHRHGKKFTTVFERLAANALRMNMDLYCLDLNPDQFRLLYGDLDELATCG